MNDLYTVYLFDPITLSEYSKLDVETCSNFLESFSLDKKSIKFNKIDDFNPCKAFPFFKIDEINYFLPSAYLLLEALYETPFYWMIGDKKYRGEFSKNRGAFTENIATILLGNIFGVENVYKNIEIYEGKKRLGEIDVLVVYDETILIIQAKSKKLSLFARQGVLDILKKDFKSAVQDAYDQAFQCSNDIIKQHITLYSAETKKELKINKTIKKIFPICLLSESYPTLTLQAKDFLKASSTSLVEYPYVLDVFFLDILCEYLNTPILLLSYIHRRVNYSNILSVSNEFTVLAFHLQKNLYLEDEKATYHIDESFTYELDADFTLRRSGFENISKKMRLYEVYQDGFLGKLIFNYHGEFTNDYLRLCLYLLKIGEDSWKDINLNLNEIFKRFNQDKLFHSLGLPIIDDKSGITFCIDKENSNLTKIKLDGIIKKRKYISKANHWIGVILKQESPYLREIYFYDTPWKYDTILELEKSRSVPKVGRNESCPCGSGKKYKKCCI